MHRLALISRVPILSKPRSFTQHLPISLQNRTQKCLATFAASYSPRRTIRQRPTVPFFDPENKNSLIKAHIDPDLYYFIQPTRTTQSILDDFKLGLFPVNRYAFGTLLYNGHIDAAWSLLRSNSKSLDESDHPKGGIYGMFMEYLGYSRTFKGMSSFSKELDSRDIPLCNGFYQNLFMVAAYEQIDDLNILYYWFERAKKDLGSKLHYVMDKVVDVFARINYEETLKIVNNILDSGMEFNTTWAIAIMRTCLYNEDKENLLKYYTKAIVQGVRRHEIIGLVIQAVGLHEHDLQGAESWYAKVQFPVTPPLTFTNSMALVYIEHGKYEEALQLIKRSKNPTGKLNGMSVYLLMKVHYLRNDLDRALGEMNAAHENTIKLEARHYNLLFGMLYKKKAREKAWELFEQMSNKKVYPTGATYEILYHTFYESSQGSQGWELFESEMMKRRIRVTDEFLLKQIQSFAYEGNEQKTLRSIMLIDDTKDRALVTALNFSSAGNKIELFKEIVKMCEKRLSNSYFSSVVIAGYGRLGLFEEALSVFEKYAAKEKVFISTGSRHVAREMVKACIRCGQTDYLSDLSTKCISQHKMQPFRQFYEIQIHHFARSHNYSMAEALFEEMKNGPKRVQPSLSTFITMTFMYALQGDTMKMQEYFAMAKKAMKISMHSVEPVDKLLRNEELKFEEEGYMLQPGSGEADLSTLAHLFTIVIQGFSNAGCYAEAFVTYEMMKNTRVPIDSVTYTVLIDAVKHSGEISRLEAILVDIKKDQNMGTNTISTNLITTLVEAFAASSDRRKMAEMVVLGEKYGITPTNKLAGTFLHIFPKEIALPESNLVRELISPENRFENEQPLETYERSAWSKYVTALDNWLKSK